MGKDKTIKKERLSQLALSESGFLFDTSTGSTYSLNETGTSILKFMQEENDEESIIARLMETYEVDEDTARRDIDEFLGQLKWMGLWD